MMEAKFVTPKNEQGAIVLFSQLSEELGYRFKEMGTRCPDAVLSKNGSDVRVEFEFVASNFLTHKHDPAKIDLIICWRDDWEESPLPVLALEKYLALRKPPKIPEWKIRLDKFREWRICLAQCFYEIKLARTKFRKMKLCRICGAVMRPACHSIVYTVGSDELRENEAVFTCGSCGYIWEDRQVHNVY